MLILKKGELSTVGIEIEVLPAVEGSENPGYLKIGVAAASLRRRSSYIANKSVRFYDPDTYIKYFATDSGVPNYYDLLILDGRHFCVAVEKTYGTYIPELATNPVTTKIEDNASYMEAIESATRFLQMLFSMYQNSLDRGEKGITFDDVVATFNAGVPKEDALAIGDKEGMYLSPKRDYGKTSLQARFALLQQRFDAGKRTNPSFYIHYNTSMPLGVLYSDIYDEVVGSKMSLPLKSEFAEHREWPSCFYSSTFEVWEKELRSSLQLYVSSLNIAGPDPYGRVEGALRVIIYSLLMQMYSDLSDLPDEHFPKDRVYKINKDYFAVLPKTNFDEMLKHCLNDLDKALLLTIIGGNLKEQYKFFKSLYEFMSSILGKTISASSKFSIVISGVEETISLRSFIQRAVINPLRGRECERFSVIFKTIPISETPHTATKNLALPIFEFRLSDEHPIKLATMSEQLRSRHQSFVSFALKYHTIYERNGIEIEHLVPMSLRRNRAIRFSASPSRATILRLLRENVRVTPGVGGVRDVDSSHQEREHKGMLTERKRLSGLHGARPTRSQQVKSKKTGLKRQAHRITDEPCTAVDIRALKRQNVVSDERLQASSQAVTSFTGHNYISDEPVIVPVTPARYFARGQGIDITYQGGVPRITNRESIQCIMAMTQRVRSEASIIRERLLRIEHETEAIRARLGAGVPRIYPYDITSSERAMPHTMVGHQQSALAVPYVPAYYHATQAAWTWGSTAVPEDPRSVSMPQYGCMPAPPLL